MIRVLVVDDHPLVRQSLADLLEASGRISVVGQCADGGQVAAVVARTRPDVLLLDLHMPGVDGLTVARRVRTSHPGLPVLVLTVDLSTASVRAARAAGAVGYLLKDDDPAALAGHVHTVAAGGSAWHPRATALLPRRPTGAPGRGRVLSGPAGGDPRPTGWRGATPAASLTAN